MKLIIEILLMGLAVAIAAFLIPGVTVDGYFSALLAGVLISLANATIGTILRVFTFPINITECMVLIQNTVSFRL